MKDIIIGSHVNMSGTELLVGSVKSALSFNANTFMFYTGAPQNTIRKDISLFKINESKENQNKLDSSNDEWNELINEAEEFNGMSVEEINEIEEREINDNE